MKRYLLFIYPFYEACGGCEDIKGHYTSLKAALIAHKRINESGDQKAHILDIQTGFILYLNPKKILTVKDVIRKTK